MYDSHRCHQQYLSDAKNPYGVLPGPRDGRVLPGRGRTAVAMEVHGSSRTPLSDLEVRARGLGAVVVDGRFQLVGLKSAVRWLRTFFGPVLGRGDLNGSVN